MVKSSPRVTPKPRVGPNLDSTGCRNVNFSLSSSNTATNSFFYRAVEPGSLIADFRHISRFAN